jgi:hypothetical protein
MLYNLLVKNNQIQTAGKITIFTAVSGMLIFAFIFLFNAGKTELMKVEAQSATTTLTVLNTPPQWLTMAHEQTESSTSTPTNSTTNVTWAALAEDPSNAPYFLLVCSTSATPTANAAPSLLLLGTAPPECDGGIQWGVSASTTSNTVATVATTTQEAFAESNDWFAWICDDDPVNPRCNNTYSQGISATNSSPFYVNHRPVFTSFYNDSTKNPGEILTFFSTSSDSDTVVESDPITLVVCNENDFNPTTRNCGAGGTISSTTINVHDNATTSYTLPSVIQDDVYDAFGFMIDGHGHTASGGAHGTNVGFTVGNVAPTVSSGDISLNGGSNITLSVDGAETTGFTLDFTLSDANSCVNAASSPEITRYEVALHRSGVGTSTCTGLASSYNPNNCYPSGVATTSWNLNCTASSTSCGGPTDPTKVFNCTFPLWYVADPTDATALYATNTWVAAISGVDDNNATGTMVIGSSPVELISFPAIDLITAEIPYGALEPGDNTGSLTATTTIRSVGNTGLNQNIEGEAMCTNFSVGSPCVSSASSTIPDFKQEFATSSVAYGSGFDLSSSTPQLLALKVQKTTATTTPNTGVTYWGIEVPVSITLAGAYTGLNTFYAVISSSTDW